MKSKTVIMFLVINSFITFIYAQELNKMTGIAEKGKFTELVYKFKPIATYNNTFTYLLLPNEESVGKYGNYYRVEQYDYNMNLIKRVQIDLQEGTQYKRLNELIYFQGKLNLFTSFQNEVDRKVYIFHQTLDLTTLELKNDIKTVAKIEYNKYIKNFRLQSNYSVSEDGSKLLIYAYPDKINYVQLQKNPTGKEIEEKRQFIYVFDKNINLLWQQEAGKAIQSGLFVFDNYHVDNLGNVFITGKNFENENEMNGLYIYSRKKKLTDRYYTYVQPSNYKHSILYFGNNGTITKQLDFSPSNIFAKSITIYPSSNNLFCAGIYSASNTISAKGVYTCKINLKNGATENLMTKPFEKKYLKTLLNTDDVKKFHKVTNKNEWNPFNFSLSKLEKTEGGEYIFIAEQQLVGKLESNSGQMLMVYPTYNYNNLYTVGIASSGEIKFIQEIEKSQFGLGDKLHSYNYFIDKTNLFIILNSMPVKTGLMKVSELQNTLLISIDDKGNKTDTTVTDYIKPDKKTVYMQTYAALPLTDKKGFIYPLQSLNYKYRTYEIIRYK